jgi:hypothetical protein
MMTYAIITGGRDHAVTRKDLEWVADCIVHLGITTVLHGACPTGADQIVGAKGNLARIREYCQDAYAFTVWPFPITPHEWRCLGNRAGPLRNGQMVARCRAEDYCLAFPGGRGTADCVRQATQHGLTILRAYERPWNWEGTHALSL